jgi:hypothetical protein
MTSLCPPSPLAPTSIVRGASFALLGGAAALACSEPLPPPAEAGVSISKQVAQSVEAVGLGACPDTHGPLMFPAQGSFSLSATTPAATVIDTMTKIESGVRCTVSGGSGAYAIDIDIDENKVGGVGTFKLSGVNVQNGNSVAPADLYWLYQGFGYGGKCTVSVDQRPPTEESPDGLFVEPGSAKVTFTCDPFTNSDNQACRAQGTVFVRNCKK